MNSNDTKIIRHLSTFQVDDCEESFVKTFFSQNSTKTQLSLRQDFLENFQLESPCYENTQLNTIVVATTLSEICKGNLYTFFINFFQNFSLFDECEVRHLLKSKERFHLIISTNQSIENDLKKKIRKELHQIICQKSNTIEVELLLHNFQLSFFSCNLQPEDDTYIKENHVLPGVTIPNYGYRSGPNKMFYITMQFFHHYFNHQEKDQPTTTNNKRKNNAIFYIETDCYPVCNSFFQKLRQLVVINAHAFIIGSHYKGLCIMTKLIHRHINGVAIYNVENKNFQHFLLYIEKYHRLLVKICPYVAYDCVIEYFLHSLLFSNIQYDHWKQKENVLIRLILSSIVNSNLILNVSTEYDKNLSNHQLLKLFPDACILHKKDFNK